MISARFTYDGGHFSHRYDARNSLDAGAAGASEEHWRQLCISIAKSAEDEKTVILEQVEALAICNHICNHIRNHICNHTVILESRLAG